VIAAKIPVARYFHMRDPEPRSVAETARQEGAQGRIKSVDPSISAGEVDASDPMVAEIAEVADQVGANA
jgi:hypothetical protein